MSVQRKRRGGSLRSRCMKSIPYFQPHVTQPPMGRSTAKAVTWPAKALLCNLFQVCPLPLAERFVQIVKSLHRYVSSIVKSFNSEAPVLPAAVMIWRCVRFSIQWRNDFFVASQGESEVAGFIDLKETISFHTY